MVTRITSYFFENNKHLKCSLEKIFYRLGGTQNQKELENQTMNAKFIIRVFICMLGGITYRTKLGVVARTEVEASAKSKQFLDQFFPRCPVSLMFLGGVVV